jgi:hypothetical protein
MFKSKDYLPGRRVGVKSPARASIQEAGRCRYCRKLLPALNMSKHKHVAEYNVAALQRAGSAGMQYGRIRSAIYRAAQDQSQEGGGSWPAGPQLGAPI